MRVTLLRTTGMFLLLGALVIVIFNQAKAESAQFQRFVDQQVAVLNAPSVLILSSASLAAEPAAALPGENGPKIQTAFVITGTINQTTICSQIWDSFPDPDSLPIWLTTPDTPAGLATDVPYTYLAGQLIKNGAVNASDCPSGGLLSDGSANTCGLERARQQVTAWQNQFDQAIYEAALRNAIPAQLLKRIFAQESQFWPGGEGVHFGLGHTTEGGLDPLFVWDTEIYRQVCPAVFGPDTCSKNYIDLSGQEKSMLRGYVLANRINAKCETCTNGIDMGRATASVDIFARLLVANCYQTDRLITNLTGLSPGRVSPYEDLWRFTLVNYNTGAGCLATSLSSTKRVGGPWTWDKVSGYLTGRCSIARTYVDKITQ